MGMHCYVAAFQLLLARPSKSMCAMHIFANGGLITIFDYSLLVLLVLPFIIF